MINGQAHEIVGIVVNVRGTAGSVAAAPGPVVYWPANAYGGTHRYFLVRTRVPPEQLVEAIRQQVYQADPRQSIGNVVTMDQLLGDAVAEPRLNAAVVGSFAGIALLLACVGIYGVMSYMVVRRTNEIGIRMTLGAGRGEIVAMIVREAGVLLAAGLVAGIALSLAAGRAAGSMLFGLKPYDPLTLALGAVLLALVALAASYVPALRASRLNPTEALREE